MSETRRRAGVGLCALVILGACAVEGEGRGEGFATGPTETGIADAGTPESGSTGTEGSSDVTSTGGDETLDDGAEIPDVAPMDEPIDFDLAAVEIIGSPDVRGFAITSELTSLQFRPDNIHVDHTLRGQWPPVQIADDGTLQEATLWVFFRIDGQWYGTGGERLRPDQTDKQLTNPSHIGPGWLYDPNRWGPMTNYVPAPGELVGFMVVAGSTRSDDHVIVQERTGVVLVPFPADDVETVFPPFAWTEQ